MSSDLVEIPMVSMQVPKTIEECTPAALLPAALRTDSPEINFKAPLKRRRCIGKQEPLHEYGRILRQLQHDSTSSLLPWQANWTQRRQAYHEYELDTSEAMGCSRKLIRVQTQVHWKAASPQESMGLSEGGAGKAL